MKLGRKFLFTLIGLGIITGAFVLMAIKQPITDGLFIAWMGGAVGLVGVYTTGNVVQKKNGK